MTSWPKRRLLAFPHPRPGCIRSQSHWGHGKGPTFPCAGVEGWDALLPGREGPETQGNVPEEPGDKRVRAQTQTHRATRGHIRKHVTTFLLELEEVWSAHLSILATK